jgi:hypothetical protein
MMKKYVSIVAILVCFSARAELSSEIVQINTELNDLRKTELAHLTSKVLSGKEKITQLTAVQDQIKQKIALVAERWQQYWPSVKEHLDGPCAVWFDRCNQAAPTCCKKISCNITMKSSKEEKQAFTQSMNACKIDVLTAEGAALCKLCPELARLMFDAAMHVSLTTNNQSYLELLKPYTEKYLTSGK